MKKEIDFLKEQITKYQLDKKTIDIEIVFTKDFILCTGCINVRYL
jgi:hypothetical protein